MHKYPYYSELQQKTCTYLTELDLGEAVDLDELVDAAERRLALAGDEVGADAEAVDGVALVGDDVTG